MDVCSFYPPKYQTLSDAVIGNVQQRSFSLRNRFAARTNGDVDSLMKNSFETCIEVTESSTLINRSTTQLMKSAKPKHQPLTRKSEQRRWTRALTESEVHAIASIEDVNRERRRVKQMRYREKKRKLAEQLEKDTHELRSEIADLEVRFDHPKQTVWTVAIEYLRVLVSGELYTNAEEFLLNSMAPDVTDGVVVGSEAVLKTWQLFSLYFDAIVVHLDCLYERSPNSLIARTTSSITFTTNTLRRVFPHLHHSLASKLQDKTMHMQGSVHFDWDDASKRMAAIYSHSDMLTPLLHFLGNLEGVSQVFHKAFITPDFRLTTN